MGISLLTNLVSIPAHLQIWEKQAKGVVRDVASALTSAREAYDQLQQVTKARSEVVANARSMVAGLQQMARDEVAEEGGIEGAAIARAFIGISDPYQTSPVELGKVYEQDAMTNMIIALGPFLKAPGKMTGFLGGACGSELGGGEIRLDAAADLITGDAVTDAAGGMDAVEADGVADGAATDAAVFDADTQADVSIMCPDHTENSKINLLFGNPTSTEGCEGLLQSVQIMYVDQVSSGQVCGVPQEVSFLETAANPGTTVAWVKIDGSETEEACSMQATDGAPHANEQYWNIMCDSLSQVVNTLELQAVTSDVEGAPLKLTLFGIVNGEVNCHTRFILDEVDRSQGGVQ